MNDRRWCGPALAHLPLLLALGCTHHAAEQPEHLLEPEWGAHEAVWFSYGGTRIDKVLDQVVLALDTTTFIVVVVENDSLAKRTSARFDSLGLLPHRFRIEQIGDTLYPPVVRDAGPIFLRRKDGGLAVLDAAWNYYGDLDSLSGIPAHDLAFQDSFPRAIAGRLGLPVVESGLVIEGGACEMNGRGDLLQVEAVTLQRNPGWSRDSIESELERVLGARRIIWLKEGPADDLWYLRPRIHGDVFNQGTGGHVDEFCRFVNDSTVLLAWPDDDELTDSIAAYTRARMAVNRRILEDAGITVVPVPTPVAEFHPHRVDSTRSYDRRVLLEQYTDVHHGDTIRYIHAASYLNLLITNGRVFVPAYWHEGMPEAMRSKDERVRAIVQQHFPDRTVVQVDPRGINRNGGGIHCWTQQQPRAVVHSER